MMYNIGFDAKRLFNNFTGLGNYSRTLVADLEQHFPQHRYHLFTPKSRRNARTEQFYNSDRFHLHYAHGFKPLWRPWLMLKDLKKEQIDLYHGLSHEIPLGLAKTGIKSVVTIHDLIFLHYPRQYGRLDNLIYNFKFRYACENSDKIIAISESTKQDIMRFYQIKPEKIEVVYQTCDISFMQPVTTDKKTICQKYPLPAEYLLYVGTIIERKNLLNIVKALELLPDAPPLAVIGKGGAYKDQVVRYVAEHGLNSRVIFLNEPTFADFPAIYHYAAAFIYPSVYEGFGIPVLEALATGTPVITSNLSSLPEAAGPSSMLVNPLDVEELSGAINQALSDTELRKKMIAAGKSFVERFNRNSLTGQVMQIYKQLLK